MFTIIYCTLITLSWNLQFKFLPGLLCRLCIRKDIRNEYQIRITQSNRHIRYFEILWSRFSPPRYVHFKIFILALMKRSWKLPRRKECSEGKSVSTNSPNDPAWVTGLLIASCSGHVLETLFSQAFSRELYLGSPSIARFFSSLWASWKREAFCYRRSEQQPRACVFLYIVDVGTSLGRRMGKMVFQDKFPSSPEIRGPILGRHRWP